MLKVSFQAHQANTQEVAGRNWSLTIAQTDAASPDEGKFLVIANSMEEVAVSKKSLLERSRQIIAHKMAA
jgi:hypothetical protein